MELSRPQIHELRAMLGAVQMGLECLHMRMAPGDRTYYDIAHRNVSAALKMLEDRIDDDTRTSERNPNSGAALS